MNTEIITVTQALTERKLLSKRIEKATVTGNYFGVLIGEQKLPENRKFRTEQEQEANIKGSVDSVLNLLKRYRAIVAALVVSNANTKITIGGKEMMVASAIELKKSIDKDRLLVVAINEQLSKASTKIAQLDAAINRDIQAKVIAMYSGEAIPEIGTENYNAVAAPHRANHTPELHDPAGMREFVENRSTWVDDFIADVETQLNIINATTTIEIKY